MSRQEDADTTKQLQQKVARLKKEADCAQLIIAKAEGTVASTNRHWLLVVDESCYMQKNNFLKLNEVKKSIQALADSRNDHWVTDQVTLVVFDYEAQVHVADKSW